MAAGLPLSDVKVADLMWVVAGPTMTRTLADYGATVVHVESTRRVDTARTAGPFLKEQRGPEDSGLYLNLNAGKLGVTLDLGTEAGRGVFLDLVRWADVVCESFTPRAMPAWGLDYEALRQVKPGIIMVSTCLMGQTGPLASFAGFGNLGAALAGLSNLCGWPDRPPSGPWGAYTDYLAPRFLAAAVLAALDYRSRTGQGQYIDQSHYESALHFLGPALLDYTVNGRVQERTGNRDPSMAPHGVYPASGVERWVAIAVGNEEQWRSLCTVLGQPEMARDERFATMERRLANQDQMDSALAELTRRCDAVMLETALQACGVPVTVVRNSRELSGSDPQLAHRGHFVELEHPLHGTITVEGSRFKLSRTPARVDKAAPIFGRDNQHVLETILGYSSERIADLMALGVLE